MEDRGWQCGMCDYRSLIGILCVAAFYFYCAAGDLSPLLHILEIIFLSFCPFFPSIFFPSHTEQDSDANVFIYSTRARIGIFTCVSYRRGMHNIVLDTYTSRGLRLQQFRSVRYRQNDGGHRKFHKSDS